MRFKLRLTPQHKEFFRLYERAATNAVETARLLAELRDRFPEDGSELVRYVGGWRIMRTLGQRLYSMEPAAGFSAQTCAGSTIYLATGLGYPLSTTQVISGAVMGAGATRRCSAVRWGVAGNIVLAWRFTLPAAGLVAAACYVPIAAIF